MEIIFWISSGLVVYAYIGYPIALLLLGRVRSKRPKAEGLGPLTLPHVSVIVAAYNEEKVIGRRIENLLDLDYPKDRLEIMVVSDGSTDGTDDIVSKYARSGVRLVRQDPRRGKVSALNLAATIVSSEIMLYSDANTIFENDAVRKLVRNFSDPAVGGVCGELIFKGGAGSGVGEMEGVYWRYERFLKREEGLRGSLLGANGGIYAVRKCLFDPVPAGTIVEDFVIPMRILGKGYRVVYEPEAVAHEETSKRIIQEMERRTRIGAGDFQALSLTWRMLNPSLGFPAIAYLSHKVIRWFAPFLLMVAFASNAALAGKCPYDLTFMAQSAFYAFALIGRMLSALNVRFRIFSLPYYFISMNLALFFGFIRFCANSQSVTWDRTER